MGEWAAATQTPPWGRPGSAPAWPPPVDAGLAGVAETHVSVVVFIGDRAYKLKKPVALGFLDHSTREMRQAVCELEVELNRRFAPDVYLGVAGVHGPDGDLCDHLVVMKRMPADRRLATMAAAGAELDDVIWKIAHRMAAVHASAPSTPDMAATATVAAVSSRWEESFEDMRPFVGTILDERAVGRTETLVRRYLGGREPLFAARIREGRIRDGHGDLLAEDIFCLDDGPRILDCLEFDPRLRWGDVLSDMAFLAMDLEHLGRPDLSARLLDAYRELSAETWPGSLARHYLAYRAHVRSKVMCLRHTQGDAIAAASAREYLDLTLRHLERGQVTMVLIGGFPGSGKSTLARALAHAGAGVVLSSDEIRKHLAGLTTSSPAPAGFDQGIYRPELTSATYRELLRRGGVLLGLGESVLLDATWQRTESRQEAARLAQETGAVLVELRCAVPLAIATERLADPARNPGASDATPEIAAAVAGRFDPWPSAIPIDMTLPPERAAASALPFMSGQEGFGRVG